jgi:hypothetical protein
MHMYLQYIYNIYTYIHNNNTRILHTTYASDFMTRKATSELHTWNNNVSEWKKCNTWKQIHLRSLQPVMAPEYNEYMVSISGA